MVVYFYFTLLYCIQWPVSTWKKVYGLWQWLEMTAEFLLHCLEMVTEFLQHQSDGHRISAAPVRDDCRVSVAPVRGGWRISVATVREGHRISVAPVREGHRISAAPVRELATEFNNNPLGGSSLLNYIDYNYEINRIKIFTNYTLELQ